MLDQEWLRWTGIFITSKFTDVPTHQLTKSLILKGFAATLAQDHDLVRFGIAESLARAVGPPHADPADLGLLPEPDVDARIVAGQVAVRGSHVSPDRT